MLLASQQSIILSNTQMNSLVRTKMPHKISIINSSSSSNNSSHNTVYNNNVSNVNNNIQMNGQILRPSISNQRKVINATNILKNVDQSRDLLKHQEEIRKKITQETQASNGCFITVNDSHHQNFVIPCIPLHLCSIQSTPSDT